MRAGNMSEGVGAGEDRQSEGEGHAGVAYSEIGDTGCQNRAPATAKHQPGCPQKLRNQFAWHVHRAAPAELEMWVQFTGFVKPPLRRDVPRCRNQSAAVWPRAHAR